MRKDFYNIYNVRMTVLAILLAIFSLSAAAKDSVVERGMDKKEVKAILGKPKATSFDQYGETWTYYKESILDCNKLITVHFDQNGKVVTYHEQLSDATPSSTPPAGTMQPIVGPGYSLPLLPSYSLNEQAFSFLLGKVRSASFDDDKYTLLEVASLGCFYTCNQCARMMELFSFSDGKLHVLKIMAPRIVDAQNAYVIYKTFTFDSDKEKATEIMAGK